MDLLDELGETYDYLYKIHTGHHINGESDDSDTSTDSSSLDEDLKALKPPLYTVDEINQNVINVESSTDPEEIARKLSTCISDNYCAICKKRGNSPHYRKPNHYHKVRQWLEKEFPNSWQMNLNFSNIFCEICNLALSGNNLAQKHYESIYHKYKSRSFCLPCLRSIPENDMPNHLKSKKHENNVQTSPTLHTNWELTEDDQIKETIEDNKHVIDDQQINILVDISDSRSESNQNDSSFYPFVNENFLKTEGTKNDDFMYRSLDRMGTDNNDLNQQENGKTVKEYGALAFTIMDLLSPSYCYICTCTTVRSHYNNQKHHKALEKLIEGYADKFNYGLQNIEDLICFVCHAIFPSKKHAQIHYGSLVHQIKFRSFCNVCLLHIVGISIEDHNKQIGHKTQQAIKENKIKERMALRKCGIILTQNDIKPNKVQSTVQIHGIEEYDIRAIIENKKEITSYCEPIAMSLMELFTPTYCFLCNKSALKNNRGNFRHYGYESHKNELKKWINSLDLNNYQSLYCEWCNQIFLNPGLAKAHYNTPAHKETCHVCKLQGGYHKMSVNKLPVSENFEKVGQGYVTTDSENEEDQQDDNVDSSTNDHIGSIIAEKLENMFSPNFCHVCKKTVNMHVLNHHYVERQHTINLRNWLKKEITKLGVNIDQKLFYCEDCSLELGGTNESLKHYETVTHAFNKNTYCSVCIFRGTPDTLKQHISSKQHRDNANKLLKETSYHSSWPKELTKFITLSECKICIVKFYRSEVAKSHYSSKKHNVKVNTWLHYYKQFGDNGAAAVNENCKRFSCPFCDSSFTSEQELDDHKNSHFPTLGGTKDPDSSQKFKAKTVKMRMTSKPKKQKLLSEGTIVNKESPETPQQNEKNNIDLCSSEGKLEIPLIKQPIEISTSGNRHNEKVYENIRTEINKLINVVYFSKTLPLHQSLMYLKDFNSKLADTERNYRTVNFLMEKRGFIENINPNYERNNNPEPKSAGAIKKTILSSTKLNTSNSDAGIERDYVKTKLFMEMSRLKMVFGNKDKIPTDLALKYLQNLNQMLDTYINNGFGVVEFESIFDNIQNTSISGPKSTSAQDDLQVELDKLNNVLLDSNKITAEVSLDFITQFNVQLESFLQFQEGEYFSDDSFCLTDYY